MPKWKLINGIRIGRSKKEIYKRKLQKEIRKKSMFENSKGEIRKSKLNEMPKPKFEKLICNSNG